MINLYYNIYIFIIWNFHFQTIPLKDETYFLPPLPVSAIGKHRKLVLQTKEGKAK